jgi:thymidylate kinase
MKKVAEQNRKLLLDAAETLTPEQRAAAFAALRAETERSIRDTLGEKAFKDYQRRGGNWLIELGESGQK